MILQAYCLVMYYRHWLCSACAYGSWRQEIMCLTGNEYLYVCNGAELKVQVGWQW